MKKTMTKIFALVLVLAMVIGFVAMIPANAAAEDSVQFMGHNVYFDEYIKIMYAVYIPEGTEVEKIELSDGTNTFSAEVFVDDVNGNPVIDEKECTMYVASNGVSLQNIDTVVNAKAYVGGEVVAEDNYSVLQYLHKRLVVDNVADTNKVAMYESLLDTAEKMQAVLNTDVTLHKTSYVCVTNGTINGTTETMVKVGETLANVTTSLEAGEGQEIEWTVTEYNDKGEAGVSVTMTPDEVKEKVVENGVNLVLTAGLKDIGTEDPAIIEDGQYAIVANGNAAMSAELSSNKLPGIAVNVTEGVATGSGVPLWTVTNVDGGVTLSYNGQYLAHTSASSTNLSLQADAYTWTVVEGENGEIYLDSTAGGTTARGLMYRDGSDNVFGAYALSNDGKDGYHRAMLFCTFEECAHTNTTTQNAKEATCGEDGYTGDKVCTNCGATVEEGQVREATGDHDYVEGICSVCGAVDPDFGGGETDTLITASKTVATLITENGWTSSTTKQSFNLDSNVSVKINGGSNTGKAYDGDHIRIYATDSPAGTITISVPTGYELVSVKVSTQTGTYAYLCVDGTSTDICNEKVSVSGTSVTLNSVKNGSNGKQVRVTAIEVEYKKTATASSLRFNEIATPSSRKEWF